MFKNYLLASFRTLTKEKRYTAINTIGLAIGLATCFLIYSWVYFESDFDTDFKDSDRIYRLVTSGDKTDERGIASTYPMVRTRILTQFPEVEASTRLFDRGFLGSKTRIAYKDKVFTDNAFYYGDPSTLEVFPFEMIYGDALRALEKPNAIIITRTASEKVFGTANPIGETIVMGSGKTFEVTAVIEDLPQNMHFQFDFLASMESHPWVKSAEENVWSGIVFHTYAKLKEGNTPEELETKIAALLDNFPNDPDHYGRELDLRLQPIQDIHLRSDMQFELMPNGNIRHIYLFLTIAILVLIVAIINYTNLATARHTQRFREVAVRKVLGATRSQLITQFMIESVVVTSIAFALAVFVVKLAQPYLVDIAGQAFIATDITQPEILLAAIVIAMLIGLFTGLVPALALSGFKPVNLIRANVLTRPGGVSIRKILMVTQFTVSISLVICTAITYKQINFLQNAGLGYELDHTVVLNIGYKEILEKYAVLKSELLSSPAIPGVTATSQLPTDIQTSENIDLPDSENRDVTCISVDPDFFKVMGVKVLQGADLISSIEVSDTINHFVLNESALKAIGWKEDEAVNKLMSIRHGNQRPGSVMGVVSDFHFQSLHQGISPLVLEFNPREYQYLLVKLNTENVSEAIAFIGEKWQSISADIPFEYMFLDQQYNSLYKSEKRSSSLFIAFSIVAIFISLLGLFGLSAFAVERRTREIGLRKILGARVSDILMVISKDFLILLIFAFILSVPIGFYFMDSWLSNFAFRTTIGPGLFVVAGLANVLLGLLTLSYHSLKISDTNPVNTLRHE